MSDGLNVNRDGAVLLLTLTRPEVRNALDSALVHRLLDALHHARRDEDVRAVVLTGVPPAFCAGGDLGDIPLDADAAALATRHGLFVELAQALGALPQPVVAAVNGPAVGAGVSLALACDHVVMATDAVFQLSFLKVGLPPDLLSAVLLRSRAGATVASELLYTGRTIVADEAVRLHLATETASAALSHAIEVAKRLAELPPFAFATTKSLLRHAAALGETLAAIEPFAIGAAAASHEFLEATARYRR